MDAQDFAERTSRTGGRDATSGVIPGRFALSVGMPSLPAPRGWRWTPLSDVSQLESGHTPSRRHPEYWNGGIPWIGIRDAVDNHGRMIHDTVQHVAELGLENSSARLLPADTVCLSRTASVGYVVVMGRAMATSQDFVNWVCGPGLRPAYLKYVLLAENDSLLRFASGTTHQTIYYPEAKAFHALLPPVEEQDRILAVLAPLDDKIDLNRRMNETLEAMARALFKSWFVDFDPVRAKSKGRAPAGIDAATGALFPDSLVKTDLGEVPCGWRPGRIGDLVTLQRGFDITKAQQLPGDVPVVSSGGIASHHNEAAAKGPGVVLGRKGVVGSVWYVDRDYWPHDTTLWVKDFKGNEPRFVYYVFRVMTARLAALDVGSANPTLNRNHLHMEPVVLPPKEVQAGFRAIAGAWLELAASNDRQNSTLVSLRDLLLPKLLSGELRVRDADRIVERAV